MTTPHIDRITNKRHFTKLQVRDPVFICKEGIAIVLKNLIHRQNLGYKFI